jgi:hypothetical protein
MDRMGGMDEPGFERLPGMPLLDLFTGTLLSLVIWGTAVVIAWRFVSQ